MPGTRPHVQTLAKFAENAQSVTFVRKFLSHHPDAASSGETEALFVHRLITVGSVIDGTDF